jgi:hypothetical protein
MVTDLILALVVLAAIMAPAFIHLPPDRDERDPL